MTAHLALSALVKRYGATVAVDNLSLEIAKGESVALLGPSGCGKTTTLRLIAGLIPPDAGAIALMGRDITAMPPHRRNMGYVFQSYALFPHMSVAGNVGFGLVERGIARAERDSRVRSALELVRLSGLAARKPRELSGGQQQRVALARALVIQPDLLLLDESLSNLDAKLRDQMRLEIRDLQKKLGITTLFVTHDQTEALTLCDRIAVMSTGRIEQLESPRDIYNRPATRFVANFVGRANRLPATPIGVGELTLAGAAIALPGPLPAGRAFEVFLRPQRIKLAAASAREPGMNRLDGRIAAELFVGDRVELLVETAAGQVAVELSSSQSASAREGEAVTLLWRIEDTLVFPAENAA